MIIIRFINKTRQGEKLLKNYWLNLIMERALLKHRNYCKKEENKEQRETKILISARAI
jgi:hypothetical protein